MKIQLIAEKEVEGEVKMKRRNGIEKRSVETEVKWKWRSEAVKCFRDPVFQS